MNLKIFTGTRRILYPLIIFSLLGDFIIWGCHKSKRQRFFFNDIFQKVSEIHLDSRKEFLLGALPKIGAIAPNGDYILVDPMTPQVLVFDSTGYGKTKIGRKGKGPGEYQYPVWLAYHKGDFYLYDSGLLRVSLYDTNYNYKSSFVLSTRVDKIYLTNKSRIFGYWGVSFSGDIVYEFDNRGKILNHFVPQSKNYTAAALYEGGGMVLLDKHLYVITPYEYTLAKYDLNGKLIKSVQGKSPHYVPPPRNINPDEIAADIRRLKKFHDSWSHIWQILQIGDKMIGVVFAEPGEARVFLDLYDADLNFITGDILLPEHMGYSGALFSKGNRLFLLRPAKPAAEGHLPNPTVVVYLLKEAWRSPQMSN